MLNCLHALVMPVNFPAYHERPGVKGIGLFPIRNLRVQGRTYLCEALVNVEPSDKSWHFVCAMDAVNTHTMSDDYRFSRMYR